MPPKASTTTSTGKKDRPKKKAPIPGGSKQQASAKAAPPAGRKKRKKNETPEIQEIQEIQDYDDEGAAERDAKREVKVSNTKKRKDESARLSTLWEVAVPLAWIDDSGELLSDEKILGELACVHRLKFSAFSIAESVSPDLQLTTWRSAAYQHFNERPTIEGSGKDVAYIWQCGTFPYVLLPLNNNIPSTDIFV